MLKNTSCECSWGSSALLSICSQLNRRVSPVKTLSVLPPLRFLTSAKFSSQSPAILLAFRWASNSLLSSVNMASIERGFGAEKQKENKSLLLLWGRNFFPVTGCLLLSMAVKIFSDGIFFASPRRSISIPFILEPSKYCRNSSEK